MAKTCDSIRLVQARRRQLIQRLMTRIWIISEATRGNKAMNAKGDMTPLKLWPYNFRDTKSSRVQNSLISDGDKACDFQFAWIIAG